MAFAMTVPMVAMTQLRPGNLVLVLTVSTLLFVFMSGRMIPGMAMITSAANPALRGTFMTLNSCVQSASMGLAALVGGHIISRDAQGLVQNYWMAGVLGAIVSLTTIQVARGLNLRQVAPQGKA